MEKGQRVTLKRPFWGHKPGTQGRITRTHPPDKVNRYSGKLKLKGSPLASVSPEDEGDLFDALAGRLKAQDLLEVATATTFPERQAEVDTEMLRKGIQHELQTTGDLEAAKENAWLNLLNDPDYYERAGQRRVAYGLPPEPPIRRPQPQTRPKTRQRLRAVEARADQKLKAPPEGEFDPLEVAVGTEVEKEHTTSPKTASTIAKQHLAEPGNRRYYTRELPKIEPEIRDTVAKIRNRPLWKTTPKGITLMALPQSNSAPSGMPG
jgi:hypothetical protein